MIATKRQPTHPGEVLGETLKEMEMTQAQLAEKLGMSLQTVNTLINGKRSMTATVAVGLAKVFDTTPELWMNLQTARDIWDAQHERRAS